MRQPTVNLVIDSAAFAAFLLLTSTGVLLRYVLPPGSGRRTVIWSLDRHEWGQVHFWISMAFLTCLAVHLVVHRRWILSMIRGRPREGSALRVALGIVGLVAVLAAAAAPFLAEVEQEPRVHRHRPGVLDPP